MKRVCILLFLVTHALQAGSFPGGVGTINSDAISKDDPAFVAWANGNLTPDYGSGVDSIWKTPQKAYGKATLDSSDIVCLGNGGQIVMTFPRPIRDGIGPDFAVFENGFSNTYLELAFVEVSSDGVNFYRFPNRSESSALVGAFSGIDPSTLSGLAGKYKLGYGTPFDLSALAGSPKLDQENVRFLRIVDIVGNGSALDSTGSPIYDPTPTTGSGGFDLEAIGVIHQNEGSFKIVRSERINGVFRLAWESNPSSIYRIETSTDLANWTSLGNVAAAASQGVTEQDLNLDNSARRFWRVLWLAP